MSAYLFELRSQCDKRTLSKYLFTRGVWFIFLEFTLIYAIWSFCLLPFKFSLQIFGATGTAMVFLSLLVYLPRWLILTLSLLIIGGHNLLDPIPVEAFGHWGGLWNYYMCTVISR